MLLKGSSIIRGAGDWELPIVLPLAQIAPMIGACCVVDARCQLWQENADKKSM